MMSRVTSYPPLGYETVFPADTKSVSFKVLIETESKSARDWEVQIWHNLNDASHWESLVLEYSSVSRLQVTQSADLTNMQRTWFVGKLSLSANPTRPISYTVRFRVGSNESWKWVHEQSRTQDGVLLFQPVSFGKHDLGYYFNHLGPEFSVEKVTSEVPDTLLWSVTANATRAQGDASGMSYHVLGLPKAFKRWFALVRLWSPWLAPRQGKNTPLAEKDAIVYSFLREDGLHVVILAISGIQDVLTVFQAKQDKLVVQSRNDREQDGLARVVVAVGRSFDEAHSAAIYRARKTVTELVPATPAQQEALKMLPKDNGAAKANWVEDWYDGFSYCTWNGLGQNLTEEKISGALESLKKEGIVITNLIIDDNWQSLDNAGQNQMVRGWTDFEANPEGFPQGLEKAVRAIRKKHPAIHHVAVWHALFGYWGGISPTGNLAKRYKTVEVTRTKDLIGGKMTIVDAPDVPRFYNDFYTFLNACGVDSVKTDAQFMTDLIEEAPARHSLISTYLSTWTTTQLRAFGGHAISCMSQTPTILFQCQLPAHLPAIPVRNSDDFFPDIEDSHPWHIFCNAHNALLARHLNVLPDWDMFQTHQKWGGFHAAARAVSGGPIYITDEPGRHDVSLIRQMTATTPRGQTVILRPSVVGQSTHVYIAFDEERLCKVGSYNGRADIGTSFLGVFNCHTTPLTEIIPLADFPGTTSPAGYVVRSHRSGATSGVMHAAADAADNVLSLDVAGHEWEVLSASPVHDVWGTSVANLGLVGQMTGGAAVLATTVHAEASGRVRVATSLKALGVWGLWGEAFDRLDLKDDLLVTVSARAVPFSCVGRSKGSDKVLEVDVGRAWREMGLKPGWSNEVDVEAFVQLKR